MSEGPYRKAEHAPARRRIEADERIAAVEHRLEPLADVFLPDGLRARLAGLRVAEDDDARVELAAALEEAVDTARIRELDLQPAEGGHPTGPSRSDLWGPIGTEAAAEWLLENMRALVLASDPGAEITRSGAALLARMHVEGTPVLWCVQLAGGIAFQASVDALTFARSRHWIGIRASTDLPKLLVRREGVGDALLKAIHLRADVATGDEAFDRAFFVEGNATFAAAILTAGVRRSLLEQVGAFELWIDRGAASLEWSGNVITGLLTEDRLRPALGVLAALQDALGALRLLRRE